MFIAVCILCALDVWLDVWRYRVLWVPGPGVVGEFFLGGFQDGEDGAEGIGSRELGAELAVGGEGVQEALELTEGQRKEADRILQFSSLLEGNHNDTLLESRQPRVCPPGNGVSMTVKLSELGAIPVYSDSLQREVVEA